MGALLAGACHATPATIAKATSATAPTHKLPAPASAVEAPAPAAESADVDASIDCPPCAEWNEPREPFAVFGNTYYVGVAGLSSVLIATTEGLVLLDGGLPQSARRIDANIRTLGFRTEDVRLIVNSHEHYDHAGGIAALQQLSGARVVASAEGARALMQGAPTEDDPQRRSGHEAANRFPPVAMVDVIHDGEALTVGDVTLIAHRTPGHTPGSTTWTWRSCEGDTCLSVVYADSLNAVSDDGFRFTGDGARPSAVPAFERSIATVDRLPCDVLLSVHPDFSGLDAKLTARARGTTPDPFIDENACHAYAAAAAERLARRVAAER
ncbi:MAG: subclass B3 metallo-beta-lactamase [Nannocystaceae bacterium]